MLLCRRVSLRRRRGRFVGTEVNWLDDRSNASRDLRGDEEVEEFLLIDAGNCHKQREIHSF